MIRSRAAMIRRWRQAARYERLEPRRLLSTVVVTTAQDLNDGDTSSILALNTNPGADGKISLREAAIATNNDLGADSIHFNIAGAGPHIITLPSELLITDTLTIDGFTQPGASPNTLAEGNNAVLQIQLKAQFANNLLHLGLSADGSVLRGLSITGGTNGIVVEADSVTISGMFIGLAPDGSRLGSDTGIRVLGAGVNIGLPNEAGRTVISNNAGGGIRLEPSSSGGTIRGAYIGTDPAGKQGLFNQSVGVMVMGSGHTLGGQGVYDRLVISGNTLGVVIGEAGNAGSNIEISGCLIGGGIDYTAPGNGVALRVDNGNNVLIGSRDNPWRGNDIGFNDTPLVIDPGSLSEVTFRLNSIHNSGFDVPDLGFLEATVESATTTPAGTQVSGTVSNATPGSTVEIDIFASDFVGDSQVFLQTVPVVIDPSGTGDFLVTTVASGMPYVSMFATDDAGGASGPSNSIANVRPTILTVTNTSGSDTVPGSLPFLLKQAALTPEGEVMVFDIPDLTAPAEITPQKPLGDMTNLIIDGTTQGGGGLVPRVYITGALALLPFVSGVSMFGMGMFNARGVDLDGGPVFGGDGFNRVTRNWLGVSPQGQPVGLRPLDTRAMVRAFGDHNVVDNNLIYSGRFMPAISSFGGSDNVYEHNLIGVNLEGNPLLNNGYGILFGEDFFSGPSSNNTIRFNTIANTSGDAISMANGTGNRIFANTLINNAGQGIDLGDNGVTMNDAGDSDAGPNGLQNFPILTLVAPAVDGTRVVGSLNSTPNSDYLLVFYTTPDVPGNGADEGQNLLGILNVHTDAAGNAQFDAVLPAFIGAGELVRATATGPDGSTSEFSPAIGEPIILRAEFLFETEYAVRVYFNEDVSQTLQADDLMIEPFSPPDSVTFDHTNNSALFRFGYLLSDDDYQATILADSVRDTDNKPLFGDFQFDFFVMAGDANRDRKINIADFLRIDRGSARGLTGFGNGDFDQSGEIDGADYFIIDQAYLDFISRNPSPSSPSSSPPSPAPSLAEEVGHIAGMNPSPYPFLLSRPADEDEEADLLAASETLLS